MCMISIPVVLILALQKDFCLNTGQVIHMVAWYSAQKKS